MSKTTADAKVYIARVLGGSQTPAVIDQANEALQRGYADWQVLRNWDFLLKDTSASTRVAVTGLANGATVTVATVSTAGTFDFINVGQTVTYAGVAGTLAAGTTVSSFTRNTDGTIATFTLSNAVAGIPTTEAGTFTFSANIPIVQGTNDYNLPRDCWEPYTARFITNSKRPLAYQRHRTWDRQQYDQTVQGTPVAYTMYNPFSDVTQDHGAMHIKFDVVPAQDDTVFLRYYRKFIVDGTYVDMIDEYLYPFLDMCRGLLLEAKRAQENPTAYLKSVTEQSEKIAASEDEVEDGDTDNYMKSSNEAGARPPIVGNGDFWPTQGY